MAAHPTRQSVSGEINSLLKLSSNTILLFFMTSVLLVFLCFNTNPFENSKSQYKNILGIISQLLLVFFVTSIPIALTHFDFFIRKLKLRESIASQEPTTAQTSVTSTPAILNSTVSTNSETVVLNNQLIVPNEKPQQKKAEVLVVEHLEKEKKTEIGIQTALAQTAMALEEIPPFSSKASTITPATEANAIANKRLVPRKLSRTRTTPKMNTIGKGHFCKRSPAVMGGEPHPHGHAHGRIRQSMFSASIPLDKRQKMCFMESNLGRLTVTSSTQSNRRFSHDLKIEVPSIKVSFSSTPPSPIHSSATGVPSNETSPVPLQTRNPREVDSPKTPTKKPDVAKKTPKNRATPPFSSSLNLQSNSSSKSVLSMSLGDIVMQSSVSSPFGASPFEGKMIIKSPPSSGTSSFSSTTNGNRRASTQQSSLWKKRLSMRKLPYKQKENLRRFSLRNRTLRGEEPRKSPPKEADHDNGKRKLSLTVSVANQSFLKNSQITQKSVFEFVDFPIKNDSLLHHTTTTTTTTKRRVSKGSVQSNSGSSSTSSSATSSSNTSPTSSSSSSSDEDENKKHNRVHRKQSTSSYEGVIFSFKFGSQDDSYKPEYGLDDHLHDQKMYLGEIKKRGHHYQNLNSALDAQYFRCKRMK